MGGRSGYGAITGPARGVGRRFSPLDRELGLLRFGYTPRLIEQLVQLGSRLSFPEAGALLQDLLGAAVPVATVRRLTEGAGQQVVLQESAAGEQASKVGNVPVQLIDQVQQVSVDGVMVPLVGGEWAEVKHLAIGRIEVTRDGPKAQGITYFARLGDHESFKTQAGVEFERRQTEYVRRVVAVTDGAEWIQGFLDQHCPDAVRIIDWGHASGYVGQASQALFGPGTADCSAWVESQLHLLRTGDPEMVVAELARCELNSGLEAVRTARQYLEKRLDQVRYRVFREAGYPIGSGMVESGNKEVVEARLKGRGRHWARANVDAMLALRCTTASERWGSRWPLIQAALSRDPHRPPAPPPATSSTATTALLAPDQPPLRAVSRAPTIVNGRPTSAHPWKRLPACHAKN